MQAVSFIHEHRELGPRENGNRGPGGGRGLQDEVRTGELGSKRGKAEMCPEARGTVGKLGKAEQEARRDPKDQVAHLPA